MVCDKLLELGGEVLVIGVYVDDLLVTGSNISVINEFKDQMDKAFDISDLGMLSYYLGIEVKQGEGFFELKQSGYAKKILERAGMLDCNPTKYPIDPKETIGKDVGGKKRCVALSTYEDEFMAATAAACQAIWLQKMLTQVTGKSIGPVMLYIDNKSAIDLTKNPIFHGRSKHIDIRYHFIRECVVRGEIIVRHVKTDEQKADVLTKALATVRFERMRTLLGIKKLLD
ncbi:hypothetical protein AgCh_015708 [Apium graveolens]